MTTTPPAVVTFDPDSSDHPYVLHITAGSSLVRLTSAALLALLDSAEQARADAECRQHGHIVATSLITEAAGRREEISHQCERCGDELVVCPTGAITPLGGA